MEIYTAAEAYEIAFGYRDVAAEVDALLRWARPPVRSVLELAAGPAEHAREFARRGMAATALDVEPAMCRFAERRAAEAGVALRVVRADMRTFTVDARYDLAFCMIDSIAHVTTLDDLVEHLTHVRDALRVGGTYVVEGSHPADMLGAKRVESSWDEQQGDVTVRIAWGDPDDRIDPVTLVTPTHVTLTLTAPDAEKTWSDLMPQRFWTPDEMAAAARLAGLRLVARYGDFGADVDLSDSRAWRMMSVLRREA